MASGAAGASSPGSTTKQDSVGPSRSDTCVFPAPSGVATRADRSPASGSHRSARACGDRSVMAASTSTAFGLATK